MAVLVAAVMCALGARADEAYACYTSSNTTLTFYYDSQRYIRPGKTYSLNTGSEMPDWIIDVFTNYCNHVVFDPSFANYRPTSTAYWFMYMLELESITDIEYLNTSSVTNMFGMFALCSSLTDIDLSSFNTANVTNMSGMFRSCTGLVTIYVGSEWSTEAVTNSSNMFTSCSKLVGGMGTTYDANHVDATYAHIDGGTSNPGYFSALFIRGDVNGDGQVKIADVTALINYLLSGDASTVNLQAADCNQDGQVKIADVTALINYLLSSNWN